jgi:phage-related protein
VKTLYFVGTALDDLKKVSAGCSKRSWLRTAPRTEWRGTARLEAHENGGAWHTGNSYTRFIRNLPSFYVANIGNAVYVLHAFNKKTEATAKADIDLGKKRFRELG